MGSGSNILTWIDGVILHWHRYSVGMTRLFNRRLLIILSGWLAINLDWWFASSMRSVVVDSWKKGPLIDPQGALSAPENAHQYLMWIALWVFNTYLLGLLLSVRFGKGGFVRLAPGVVLILSLVSAEIGMQGYLSRTIKPLIFDRIRRCTGCVDRIYSPFESSSDGIILNTNQHGMREAPIEYAKGRRGVQNHRAGRFLELWTRGVWDRDVVQSTCRDSIFCVESKGDGFECCSSLPLDNASGRGSHGGLWWKFEPDMVIAGFNNDAGTRLHDRSGACISIEDRSANPGRCINRKVCDQPRSYRHGYEILSNGSDRIQNKTSRREGKIR